MVKSKLITAHYDEESGLSYVKIANKFGTFDALAALHPKDKERGSRYAGCEYAHIRAEIKSVKEQIKSQRYRIKVLTELLAEYQNSDNVNINSTKSMIGHLFGAAGAVEFITCVKSIEDGYIHPTVGLRETEGEIDLNYTKGEGVHKDITYALSNSLGFGGHNAVLLMKKYR